MSRLFAPRLTVDEVFEQTIAGPGSQKRRFDASVVAPGISMNHAADRVIGPMMILESGNYVTNPEVNFADWLQAGNDAQESASRGAHVGYIVGSKLLAGLAPQDIVAIEFPHCGRSM